MNNVRPRLTMMTGEHIQVVHRNVLKVLIETGVRVDSPSILQMLEWKLKLKSEDRRIKIPPEIVEEAIKSAPKTIDVYDRRGELKFKLGDDRLRFWVGVTALSYVLLTKDTIFSLFMPVSYRENIMSATIAGS